MTERIDADRIVVTGRSAGSHFPRNQAAMQYRFEADGASSEGPFEIDGSVYGRDIRFRGPGTVRGPVLGRGDITLANASKRPQRFLGGLHSSGNIGCDGARRSPEESLVDDVRHALYVIRGDVVARNVVLRDAIVFGSVRGANVSLEYCVVFGQVVTTEQCVIACSTVMAYQAPKVELQGPCAFFFASGESHKLPLWTSHKDSLGRVWPWSAQLYSLKSKMHQEGLTNRPWRDGDASTETALVPTDWVRTEIVEPEPGEREGSGTKERSDVRYVLTAAARALDFSTIETSVTTIAWLFGSALEWEHYSEKTREEVTRRVAARCSSQEAKAFDLATARELQPGMSSPMGVQGGTVGPWVSPGRVASPVPLQGSPPTAPNPTGPNPTAPPVLSIQPPRPSAVAAPVSGSGVPTAGGPGPRAPSTPRVTPAPPTAPSDATRMATSSPAPAGVPPGPPESHRPSVMPAPSAAPPIATSSVAEPPGPESIATLFAEYRQAYESLGIDTSTLKESEFARAFTGAWQKTTQQFPGRRFRMTVSIKDGKVMLRPETL